VGVREKVVRLLQRQPDVQRLPPILIQGETGTGKGLLARIIHRAGPRGGGPFVDVNCAAIPGTLLEAELFGFERGAFTDARHAKPGLFQAAHRGTIFLDEVVLLPEELQGKLLKVLEERAVRRLGSTRSEPIDVWILTATNQDLLTATREGRFREDLYHRLAILTLGLPPLRERGPDILALAEQLLARVCADYKLPPKTFTPEARAALQAYRWPGNVRELGNVMERVALLSEATAVTAEILELPTALPAYPREDAPGEAVGRLEEGAGSPEREQLLDALRQTGWNITQAATRLGLTRNTLRYRIEKYGLRPGASPRPARRQAEPGPLPLPTAPAVAAPLPTTTGGIRWERQRLTLLRAALVSSPEETSPLDSSRHIEALVDKVHSFGGRIEELGSTGILAGFGLDPGEDAPERAALSATAIHKAAEQSRRAGAERFRVKTAIHLGQFMVGRMGGTTEIDQDAKRQAWTILEELLARAESDSILVSETAAPFLTRRFELMPLGTIEGMPRRAFRLVGRERTGLGPGERLARFVGRQHEMELLRDRLALAMRGHGQVVGIGGEAGIGKSRLLFEFRQSLGGQRLTYLEGHCHSHGRTMPHLPILEILRSNCRIAETDTPDAVAAKVRQALQEVRMDPDEGAPYLLGLLGVKEGTEPLLNLSPEAIWSRTLEILRQMSFKGSRRQPLIFAVEDLHWIDKASEAYFSALVEGLSGAPILFLFTYRPGHRPSWMEKSYATQIALQPLSEEDSLSVIHSALQTEPIPGPLAQLILAKAEGNPFFLEELARAVGEQGEFRPTLTVPDTVQEVILARMHRLPDGPKRLLQTASVLGREVALRLLGAIWDGPGVVDEHLRELTFLEFLYERGGGEEPVYVFKHALTQEVAYESLLDRRQALHAAAARALEALYADRLEEVFDRLAYHFANAQEADKAVEYLTRFADKAARAYAHVEAVAALQEAFGHAQRLPAVEREQRLLDLVLRQAQSLAFLGRFQDTLELLLRERERVERIKDAVLAGPYYFWLGHTYSHLGDREQAVKYAKRSLEEAGRCGDGATMGKAYVILAQECSWSGRAHQGIEDGRKAVELLERAGERWWLGFGHWIVGINYITIGEFEPALEAGSRARAIGEAIGDPRIQSYATWIIGWIHVLTGDWEAGIDACKRGLGRSPDPVNTAVALGHLGYAYLEKGEPAEAIPLLEQSLEQISQFRFQTLQGRFATFLGEAYLLNGEIDRAREMVTQGLRTIQDAKYPYGVGWGQLALGRIVQASGNLGEAESHLNDALRTFASIQARFMLGRTRLALAELSHARQSPEGVKTHLKEAYQLFHALRVPKYVERTLTLAHTLGVRL
jgi:transcriptional regulator with AAA-type ATPase domain/tetratricopeptide (TPR) repeat protein